MKKTLNVNEAFKELEMIESTEKQLIYEAVGTNVKFNLNDSDDIDELKGYLNNNVEEDPIQMVIDVDAEEDDDLKDSYVNDVILQCPICKEMIYKVQDELVKEDTPEEDEEEIDEEDIFWNVGEECPYCKSIKGFKIIGKVAPYTSLEGEVEIEDEEETEDYDESLNEGIFKHEIKIPDGTKTITKYTLSKDCGVSDDDKEKITSVVIPNSVTEIGDWAFYECSKLTSINIPESVTSIGKGAFNNCYKLTSINIPNAVKFIGDSAFANCSKLKSINIPNSVTEIGWCTFADCSSLTSITIPNSVTEIDRYAFSDCPKLIIKTDSQYVKDYCKENKIKLDESLNEGIFDRKKKNKSNNTNSNVPEEIRVEYKIYDENGTLKLNRAYKQLKGKKSAEEQLTDEIKDGKHDYWLKEYRKSPNNRDWTYERVSTPAQGAFDNPKGRPRKFVYELIHESYRGKLKESDEPAATSIEDAQKWVDYDMKRYGKISEKTNELVKKAGFQIIKDDHGDYEVAAGKFEELTEDFKNKTAQGFTVVKRFKDLDDGRIHVIAKREKGLFGKPDFIICLGYDDENGKWAQGRYDYESLESAEDDLKNYWKYKVTEIFDENVEETEIKVVDKEIDELDEQLFDSLTNKYLHEIYENVDSYKTTSGGINEDTNTVVLEGVIKFKSGKEQSTKFVFEANTITKRNKVKLVGLNETFSKYKKAFNLKCAISGTKLLPEALTYNYKAKTLTESKVVYGRVFNKLDENLLKDDYKENPDEWKMDIIDAEADLDRDRMSTDSPKLEDDPWGLEDDPWGIDKIEETFRSRSNKNIIKSAKDIFDTLRYENNDDYQSILNAASQGLKDGDINKLEYAAILDNIDVWLGLVDEPIEIEDTDFDEFDEDAWLDEDIKNLFLDTEATHMEMTSDENGKINVMTEPIKNKKSIDNEEIDDVEEEDIEETDEVIAPFDPKELEDEAKEENINDEDEEVVDDKEAALEVDNEFDQQGKQEESEEETEESEEETEESEEETEESEEEK